MNVRDRKKYQEQKRRYQDPDSDEFSQNNSSILQINDNVRRARRRDEVSALGFDKTHKTANEEQKGSLSFWFKRSDFYVTGLNFCLSRIALMCQLTTIPFFLTIVCGIDDRPGFTPYQVAVAPASSFVASFAYSILVMDKLQSYHQHDKYNLFLYSLFYFSFAGFFLFLTTVGVWTPWIVYPSLFM